MFRLTILCAALACMACATAKTGTATPDPVPATTMTPTTQRVAIAGGQTLNINTMDVNEGSSTLIMAPLDSAWLALKASYAALGIPVTSVVDARYTIGNEGYKVRRFVGKIPMRTIFDCGSSLGIPNADTYDVFMVISSYLVRNPKAGYNLVTRIDATGKSPNYNREQSVKCSSQGELERQIGEQVRKRAGY
jgi:hypothetical protein